MCDKSIFYLAINSLHDLIDDDSVEVWINDWTMVSGIFPLNFHMYIEPTFFRDSPAIHFIVKSYLLSWRNLLEYVSNENIFWKIVLVKLIKYKYLISTVNYKYHFKKYVWFKEFERKQNNAQLSVCFMVLEPCVKHFNFLFL